jgi:hypothetical protein
MDFRMSTLDSTALSPPMISIMRDYTNRAPIINQSGECPGNCTGTVRAAGLVPNCSRTTDDTYQISHQELYNPWEVVFQTSALLDTIPSFLGSNVVAETGFLGFYAFYVQTKLNNDTSLNATSRSCDGVSTAVVCVMTPATMEYPVVLRDNVITVDTRSSAVKAVQTKSNNGIGDTDDLHSTDALLGLYLAVNSIVQSNVTMSAAIEGWSYYSTGPFSYFYTNNKQDDDGITCEITSTDPTEDILTTFNEIMFRISIAALGNSSNSSLVTHYPMTAYEPVIMYQSRYRYLFAATLISLLACCSVLPTFNGFWRLNRPFSLSPIEIAKAFDAPLLRLSGAGTSDLPVDKLVKRVGTTGVQYVIIADEDGEYTKLRQRKFIVAGVA